EELLWLGPTNEGCWALTIASGKHTPGRVPADAYARYLAAALEWGRRHLGVGVAGGVCAMVDRTHGGASNADLPLAQALFPIFQEYYPEILGESVHCPCQSKFFGQYGLLPSFLLIKSTRTRCACCRGTTTGRSSRRRSR
ncbi:unnamed protein product, partial [Heterosigma akashiwo]